MKFPLIWFDRLTMSEMQGRFAIRPCKVIQDLGRNLKRLNGDGIRLRWLASLGMIYPTFRPLVPISSTG